MPAGWTAIPLETLTTRPQPASSIPGRTATTVLAAGRVDIPVNNAATVEPLGATGTGDQRGLASEVSCHCGLLNG
jgi:hypothetical protein